MSATEESLKQVGKVSENGNKAKEKSQPILNRILNFLSSVRFGVAMLIALVTISMIGMLIVQQNVNGFDAFYSSLTPAEKWLYSNLGFFDVYYSWYFLALLLVLSLNIVLASIDHFPTSWKYVSNPKLSATRGWLLRQQQHEILPISGDNENEVAEKISKTFKSKGFKVKITTETSTQYALDDDGNKNYSDVITQSNLFVFGQKWAINRLGAYFVHVALLLLFLGHFVALTTGFDADIRLMPGQVTNEIQQIRTDLDKQERYLVGLPFTITCTDIQQTLIDQKGEIGIQNTMDWRTQIKIDDPQYGTTIADVALNKPFNYRGYRFFQASAITVGSARTMSLELTPETGGEPINVKLQRNGSSTLADGTVIGYEAFFADFAMVNGRADTRSGDYNNPAVKLNITTPTGEIKAAYAFAQKLPAGAPIGAPVAGYKFHLAEFEKSPLAHVLSIKFDPYSGAFIAWYLGGIGLIFALIFVFFFSHQRVWAMIEKKEHGETFEVVFGGDSNRNPLGFEDRFNKLIEPLK